MRNAVFITSSVLLLILSFCDAAAQEKKRFSYGVEWGANSSVFSIVDYNYIGEDGSNVSENSFSGMFKIKGYIEAKAGYNFTDKWSLSLLAGVNGMNDGRIAFPVNVRTAYFTRSMWEKSCFFLLDAGLMFLPSSNKILAFSGMAGFGWRYAMEGNVSLDFISGFKIYSDHPQIYDSQAQRIVPVSDIRKNNALLGAVTLSIAINF